MPVLLAGRLAMILQIVAFTYYFLVTVIVIMLAVIYLDLSVYAALPLIMLSSPFIAIYMVHRCCD